MIAADILKISRSRLKKNPASFCLSLCLCFLSVFTVQFVFIRQRDALRLNEVRKKKKRAKKGSEKQVLTTRVQIVLFLFVQSVPITFAPS